jgi:hypothetical protein
MPQMTFDQSPSPPSLRTLTATRRADDATPTTPMLLPAWAAMIPATCVP